MFSIKDFEENWKIIIKEDIRNDENIDQFIKSQMSKIDASGCSIGNKSPAKSGVYDIEIKDDGKSLEESKDWINFVYLLKYSLK